MVCGGEWVDEEVESKPVEVKGVNDPECGMPSRAKMASKSKTESNSEFIDLWWVSESVSQLFTLDLPSLVFV